MARRTATTETQLEKCLYRMFDHIEQKRFAVFFFCSLFFVLFAVVLLRVVHTGSKVINVTFQSSICAAGGMFLISRTPRCEFKGASLELCS